VSFENDRTRQLKEKRQQRTLQPTTMAGDYKIDICGRVCGSIKDWPFRTHEMVYEMKTSGEGWNIEAPILGADGVLHSGPGDRISHNLK